MNRIVSSMAFSGVPKGLPDVMQTLKQQVDGDLSPNKIDLGAGVYRDEHGQYFEFDAIKKERRSRSSPSLRPC